MRTLKAVNIGRHMGALHNAANVLARSRSDGAIFIRVTHSASRLSQCNTAIGWNDTAKVYATLTMAMLSMMTESFKVGTVCRAHRTIGPITGIPDTKEVPLFSCEDCIVRYSYNTIK
jgi:hypothetical protein